jgi:alpha-tubulin suppressor-like RCC1 family protein
MKLRRPPKRSRRSLAICSTTVSAIVLLGGLGVAVSASPAAADQNERVGWTASDVIAAGSSHTCAVVSSGKARCFGSNWTGQLGLSDLQVSMVETPSTVDFAGNKATAITAGSDHTCVLFEGGKVRCWGNSYYGSLGNGMNLLPPFTGPTFTRPVNTINVELPNAAVAVSAGGGSTCAVLIDGRLMCWGFNFYGQLGLGSSTQVGVLTPQEVLLGAPVTAVSVGNNHTCAVLSSGNVRCWGKNDFGQLGLGHTDDIGDNEVPTQNVALGSARARAVTTGDRHTCALLADGAADGVVRCWGKNTDGQLGLGNTVTVGDNEVPTVNVDLGGRATALSAGWNHTCAIVQDVRVRCWGKGDLGQLGTGSTGSIGDNEAPTVNVELNAAATAVTTGNLHTCAYLVGGFVRCWGRSSNPGSFDAKGILGISDPQNIGDNESPTTNANFPEAVGFDPVLPSAALTSITQNQVLPGSPSSISGTASDDRIVTSVRLVIRRTSDGKYFDGFLFQPNYVSLPTALGAASGGARTWRYDFQSFVASRVTLTDGAYEAFAVVADQHNIRSQSTAFSIRDTQNPTVQIASPRNGQIVAPTNLYIGVWATDNTSAIVELRLFDGTAQRYWNGSAWQSANTSFLANLDVLQPGFWSYLGLNLAPRSTFSLEAKAIDPAGNKSVQLISFKTS